MKSPSLSLRALALAGAALFALSACAPAVIGAGATVGTAAVDERGVGGTASDARIRAEINGEWANIDPFAFTGVGLLIRGGRVVLTGTVSTPERYNQAVEVVKKVKGVTDIYVHIRVDPNAGVVAFASDAGTVAEMRKKIFFDKGIVSLNYDIDATGNVLYLLGIAQDEAEKQKVLTHARTISGVRQVVEYITVKPQARQPAPATPAAPAAAQPTEPEAPQPLQPMPPAQPGARPAPVEVQPLT